MGQIRFSTSLNANYASMTPISNYMVGYNYPLDDPVYPTVPIANNEAFGIGGSYNRYGWKSTAWLFTMLRINDFDALCSALGLSDTVSETRISLYCLQKQGINPVYQTANATIIYPNPFSEVASVNRLQHPDAYFNVTFRLLRVEFY